MQISLASDALADLNLALRRWERLASPPRHLEYPQLPSTLDAERALLQARIRGDARRAAELLEAIAAELTRRSLLSDWQSGKLGRSARAWHALVARLEAAIDRVANLGAASADELEFAEGRLADAESRALWATHWESLN